MNTTIWAFDAHQKTPAGQRCKTRVEQIDHIGINQWP